MPFCIKNDTPLPQIVTNMLTLPLEFPHHAGLRTRDVLSQMLERDPHRRITIPQLKAHPFFRSL